jgi:hypothetical protein
MCTGERDTPKHLLMEQLRQQKRKKEIRQVC